MVVPAKPSDPDLTCDIRDLVTEVVANPDQWLDHPHPMLGARKPRDLINTGDEIHLRNLLRMIKQGMFT